MLKAQTDLLDISYIRLLLMALNKGVLFIRNLLFTDSSKYYLPFIIMFKPGEKRDVG